MDQAEDGYSLAAQERTLRNWCSAKHLSVYKVYADKGLSGKDMEHRPEMLRLMKDAEHGKFSVVVFWALSRFTRSVVDLYSTMTIFQKFNISMASYTEPFDTSTPMGRATIGIIGVFAQLERELTSERVYAAMQERARQGKRTSNEVLGYDAHGKDTYIINPAEAEYVRFCFAQYLKIQNLSDVAEEARLHGYHGKRGCLPTPWHISIILSNPIYAGYSRFDGEIYQSSHPPLITVDMYNAVQRLLERQGRLQGRKRKYSLVFIPE